MKAQRTGIHIHLHHDKGNDSIISKLVVYADMHKLGKVIRNVMSNALKFTGASGRVDIIIQFHPPNNMNSLSSNSVVQIDFLDNGIGMSEVSLSHTFNKILKNRIKLYSLIGKSNYSTEKFAAVFSMETGD